MPNSEPRHTSSSRSVSLTQRATGDLNGAFIRAEHSTEQVQQGGFAGARIAQQQQTLSLAARKVRELHRHSVAILELYALNADHGPKVH